MDVQDFDLTSQDFKRSPFPTFRKMRESGPLAPTKLAFIGEAWAATTYEAATKILRDKEAFVIEPKNAGRKNIAGLKWWMPRTIRVLVNNMLQKDEPDHRRLRELVESAFMRQSIEELRPRIQSLVDRQLDVLQQRAESDGGGADLVKHFARPLPLAVISELLGFPEEDRPKFLKWASSLTTVKSPLGFFKALPGLWKLNRYFEQQFEECRKNPRPGLVSALVAAEQDGRKLSKEELVASTFLLLLAGHETTVHLISGGVATLLEHPEQLAALKSDWSLARTAVDEVLRYVSPVQMTKPRYASRDMELYGVELKQGDVVVPLLAAANCDPAQFSDPESFDVRRSPNAHLGFGTGMHLCLGQKLAWAEVEIVFERLFTRFPDLELSVPFGEIEWLERIGFRAAKQLPVQLSARDSQQNRDAA